MDQETLFELLACHSTPGDEAEVRDLLTRRWEKAGWDVQQHGHYAISASHRDGMARRPRVLVTAHMDSPGYAVEEIEEDRIQCIRLGGPRFSGDSAPVILKTARRKVRLDLLKINNEDKTIYQAQYHGKVEAGDRLCFAAAPRLVADRYVLSPFLDNRIGCYMLTHLAESIQEAADSQVDLLLAASASEEMGGFGAKILAAACEADLVICLDATYAAAGQDVHLGKGPVLTLSDASILLNGKQRRAVQHSADTAGVPLQTEVYNHSGTDAGAFPQQGSPVPVIALLIPTEGNHSPAEKAACRDLDAMAQLLHHWLSSSKAVKLLLNAWIG